MLEVKNYSRDNENTGKTKTVGFDPKEGQNALEKVRREEEERQRENANLDDSLRKAYGGEGSGNDFIEKVVSVSDELVQQVKANYHKPEFRASLMKTLKELRAIKNGNDTIKKEWQENKALSGKRLVELTYSLEYGYGDTAIYEEFNEPKLTKKERDSLVQMFGE